MSGFSTLSRLLQRSIPAVCLAATMAESGNVLAQERSFRELIELVAPVEQPVAQEPIPSAITRDGELSEREKNQSPEVSFSMAEILAERGMHDEAIRQFFLGLNKSSYSASAKPMLADAMFGLADSYAASKRPELSLQTLLLMHSHHPDRRDAWQLRARVHQSLGQHRAEREALIHCMELSPDDWTARLALAKAYVHSPACSSDDAKLVIAMLAPVLDSADPVTDNMEFCETLARAGSIAEIGELAKAAIERALVVAPMESHPRLQRLQQQIEKGQSLKASVEWHQHERRPAELKELLYGAVPTIHLEGRVRLVPNDRERPVQEYPVVRDMSAVVVGGYGELLVSSSFLELPKKDFPEYQVEWVKAPAMTLTRWNTKSGKLEHAGDVYLHAVDEAMGLGLLSLAENSDMDPLTGVKGLQAARIAADYYLASPPANAQYHYLQPLSGTIEPEMYSLSEEALLLQLHNNLVPVGTPIFNSFGEIVAVVHQKRARPADPASEQKLSLKISSDCSYAYACLAAYEKIPRRPFPFQWRLVPLPQVIQDGVHTIGMEVTSAEACANLQVGDVITEINSIPLNETIDFDLFQNLLHDLQTEDLALKLASGRLVTEALGRSVVPDVTQTVSKPVAPSADVGAEKPATETTEIPADQPVARELSRTEMSNEYQQSRQLEEWLHDNIKDPELAKQLIESHESARSAGNNYVIRCGALACRNEQAWFLTLQNGSFAAHPVSERVAAAMGIQPQLVDSGNNGKIISQGDVVFRISRVQITPIQADDSSADAGHKVLIRLRIETLSAPDSSKKHAICVETSKGKFRSMTTIEDVADVGETVNCELIWPSAQMPERLEDTDLLTLQIVTYQSENAQDPKTSSDCWSQIVSFAATR
ncbi:MAG: tetratricopeptide repeat protein [Planctomycetaceae bacterium]